MRLGQATRSPCQGEFEGPDFTHQPSESSNEVEIHNLLIGVDKLLLKILVSNARHTLDCERLSLGNIEKFLVLKNIQGK